MLSSNFLWLVPVLSLIGSGRYVWQVLRGKAKPNRVTWALWSVAPLIAFAAELDQGVGLQSIMTFMAGFGPLLILAASFIGRKAEWHITRFDLACGVLSLLGLALWLTTRQGNIAIVFSIVADLLAGLPTVAKSFSFPETESYGVFLFGAVNAAITLLTVRQWTFANYAFPTYLLGFCIILVILIKFQIGYSYNTKVST